MDYAADCGVEAISAGVDATEGNSVTVIVIPISIVSPELCVPELSIVSPEIVAQKRKPVKSS